MMFFAPVPPPSCLSCFSFAAAEENVEAPSIYTSSSAKTLLEDSDSPEPPLALTRASISSIKIVVGA